MSDELPHPLPASFRASTNVFVHRDGKILVLKRAMGDFIGAWFLPGGAVDEGEDDLEAAACRELREEARLTPAGPMTLLHADVLPFYGTPTINVGFACDCPDGDVILSNEHTAARWVDPREYIDRYLKDEYIAAVEQRDPRAATIMRGVRAGFERYIEWRAHHDGCEWEASRDQQIVATAEAGQS